MASSKGGVPWFNASNVNMTLLIHEQEREGKKYIRKKRKRKD
jgi:hypothetical protein